MRQPYWEWGLWSYRVVVTQANGAGGAIVVDLSPVAGMTMIVASFSALNSGNNGLILTSRDEDVNEGQRFIEIASAGQTSATIPRGIEGSASQLNTDSIPMETRIYRASDRFSVQQTGAGAQNDTLTLMMRALLSSAERPLVSKGRSTNPSDVTIATPTVDVIR